MSTDNEKECGFARTLIWTEVCALGDQEPDAFFPLNVAIEITSEAMDGEADKSNSILILDAQIHIGLRSRVGQKILRKGQIPE
jgi:hypothetical protein